MSDLEPVEWVNRRLREGELITAVQPFRDGFLVFTNRRTFYATPKSRLRILWEKLVAKLKG